MSKTCIFGTAGLFLFACCALSAQQKPTLEKNYVPIARQFLAELYPEMEHRVAIATVKANAPLNKLSEPLASFNVDVGDGVEGQIKHYFGACSADTPPQECKPGPVFAKRYFGCKFDFDVNDRLLSFGQEIIPDGMLKDYAAVLKTVNAHPEWTDAQAVAALDQAGAEFGPSKKEEFIANLPISKLVLFIGQLSIQSVEFEALSETNAVELARIGIKPPGGDPNAPIALHQGDSFAELRWFVRARATSADGAALDYLLQFEPVNGQLLGFYVAPFAQSHR
jgi:hypothetical protein